jgi:hypothetical protein
MAPEAAPSRRSSRKKAPPHQFRQSEHQPQFSQFDFSAIYAGFNSFNPESGTIVKSDGPTPATVRCY